MTQQQCFLNHLPKELVNFCTHINLHTDVYNNFTCNCQNLKSVNMSFCRWTEKLCSIYIMEYHLLLKRNNAPNHENVEETYKQVKKWKKLIWRLPWAKLCRQCSFSGFHFGRGNEQWTDRADKGEN